MLAVLHAPDLALRYADRMVVQDGGQAIVGAVSAGTGVPGRGEE